jgi:hypothetical protein
MTEDKADKGQWHGGKGSVQKPKDQDKFADGWDAIWGKKEKDNGLTRREQVLLDPLEASQRSDIENKKDKE